LRWWSKSMSGSTTRTLRSDLSSKSSPTHSRRHWPRRSPTCTRARVSSPTSTAAARRHSSRRRRHSSSATLCGGSHTA
jgi:hypothetical protein